MEKIGLLLNCHVLEDVWSLLTLPKGQLGTGHRGYELRNCVSISISVFVKPLGRLWPALQGELMKSGRENGVWMPNGQQFVAEPSGTTPGTEDPPLLGSPPTTAWPHTHFLKLNSYPL